MSKSDDTGPKDLPWEDAIRHVLSKSDGAMHYAEIAEQIVSQGLRRKVGATPAATVAAHLSGALKDPDTIFLRLGRGEYTLRDKPVPASPATSIAEVAEDVAESGALRAFGMFWQRSDVLWSGSPRLLGRQGLGATEVNFADQVGVYLLHDRERVIYIGRATDSVFARLKTHTTDRLGGRWDRFSWFGIRGVDKDGKLLSERHLWTEEVVIETMEAVLIESLEPPLNRKRGDNLSAIEYLQVQDPKIAQQNKKEVLAQMLKAAGLSDA